MSDELPARALAFFAQAKDRVDSGTAHEDVMAWISAATFAKAAGDDELLGVALNPILSDPDGYPRLLADYLVLGDLCGLLVELLAQESHETPAEVVGRLAEISPHRRA